MQIRPALTEDAAALYALVHRISETREWPLILPDEEIASVQEQSAQIGWFQAATNRVMLIALDDQGTITGYAQAFGGQYSVDQLTAVLVVEVCPAHRRQGIATLLLYELERWGRRTGLHRFELSTLFENRPARNLYEKCGYLVEGLKRESRFVGGQFRDEILFAKLLT
jgi:RimJ/RimL family protein N-acetyltransferase